MNGGRSNRAPRAPSNSDDFVADDVDEPARRAAARAHLGDAADAVHLAAAGLGEQPALPAHRTTSSPTTSPTTSRTSVVSMSSRLLIVKE